MSLQEERAQRQQLLDRYQNSARLHRNGTDVTDLEITVLNTEIAAIDAEIMRSNC